jgi:hypothetical protein
MRSWFHGFLQGDVYDATPSGKEGVWALWPQAASLSHREMSCCAAPFALAVFSARQLINLLGANSSSAGGCSLHVGEKQRPR